jgi:hypothetical protein
LGRKLPNVTQSVNLATRVQFAGVPANRFGLV